MLETLKPQLKRILNFKGFFEKSKKSLNTNTKLYLIIAVLIYIIVLSAFTIIKHNEFLTSGFDLGIFNQAFWTTTNDGMLFYETGDLSFNPGGSFFGVHFSPIMFLLVPFYAIWPSPEILLVMQSVILAVGAFPVFWMSRDKLGKNVGFVLSVVYLAYPALYFANLNEFHLEAFTSTFFLFSVYYLEREKWPKFFLFFALALSTIEFAPIIGVFVAFYGVILFIKKKIPHIKRVLLYLLLAITFSIGFFILGLTTKELINPTTSSIPSPFHYLFSNPAEIFNVLSVDLGAKLLFLIYLFGPLAFLPFLAPEVLIMALPWLGLSFLSSYNPYYSIFYFYSCFVIPFIFVALPKAIHKIQFSNQKIFRLSNQKRIVSLLVISTIIFSIYLPIAPDPTKSWNFKLPSPDDRTEVLHQVLPLIPPDASILTQNDIFPHVSSRKDVYMYIPSFSEISVDYILVDVGSQWYTWQQPDIFGERIPPSVYTQEALEKGTYGIVAWIKNILLLKKGYSDEPILFNPHPGFNYETLYLGSGSIVEDVDSSSGLVLRHGEGDSEGTFWFGPYVDLMPGLYKVTFVLKVDNTSNIQSTDHILTVDSSALSGQVLFGRQYVYGLDVPSYGKWFNVTYLFGLSESTELVEFRGIPNGENNVFLDYITVEQLSSQPISNLMFNSGDLVVEAGEVHDGVFVHDGGSGTFWYGPYVSLPKGDYVAKFWLRLDKPYNGSLLNLVISNNLGQNTFATLFVHSDNFTDLGLWQRFEVSFTLTSDSNSIELSGLNVRNLAPVSFLIVEVYSDAEN